MRTVETRGRRAYALAAAFALAAMLALGGCAGGGAGAGAGTTAGAGNTGEASATASFLSMDTAMSVTVHAANQQAAQEAVDACEARVAALDKLLAPAGAQSEIALLNAAGSTPTPLVGDARALLDASLAVARETDGAFDPTVYPLTAAWGFTDGDHRTPTPDEVAALLPRVGFTAVSVDDAAGTVALAGGAQVDVGGVAKGFAADELRNLLAQRGVTSAILNLGGNVTAVGSKPDGSPWKVGVTDPQAPDQLVGALLLRDATVSTSGAYQRFFYSEDGTLRHHLIDPATGYPAESDLASASVVGAYGARCDALSTALYVMGLERALGFWRECAAVGGDTAFEAVLVGDDGEVHVTAGLADAFQPAEGFVDATVVER